MISQLHYISQESRLSHEENIARACAAGVSWVQLRVKDKPLEEVEGIAQRVKDICARNDARLIINDHVEVALKTGADGVHLGKEDMSPAEARALLSGDKIIGGTANTFEDIQRLQEAGVDYIGLGPFRYTATKKKLSPVLGLAGYQSILDQCKVHHIETPVIAIGGIEVEDVSAIRSTGVFGVAIASLINFAENPSGIVQALKKELAYG